MSGTRKKVVSSNEAEVKKQASEQKLGAGDIKAQ